YRSGGGAESGGMASPGLRTRGYRRVSAGKGGLIIYPSIVVKFEHMTRFRDAVADHWGNPLAWRVLTQVLPAVAFATAAFFVVRAVTSGDTSSASGGAIVDADHAARLEAEIQFFEAHVVETKDQLAYHKLTTLY